LIRPNERCQESESSFFTLSLSMRINVIDSDPFSKKISLLLFVMIEQNDQNSLPKTLKTVKAFTNSTSEAFEKARSYVQSRGDAPNKLVDQISRRGESLEKLTNNLSQQKTF